MKIEYCLYVLINISNNNKKSKHIQLTKRGDKNSLGKYQILHSVVKSLSINIEEKSFACRFTVMLMSSGRYLALILVFLTVDVSADFTNGEEFSTNNSSIAKSRMKRYLIFQPGTRIFVRKNSENYFCVWFSSHLVCIWCSFELTSKTTSFKSIRFSLMLSVFVQISISCNHNDLDTK